MDVSFPRFWQAPVKSQSYLSILYLLISFPLGILYFVVLITGLSLGFGLFITWFGIPILVGVMFVWLGFAYFERSLAKTFLGINTPYGAREEKEKGVWNTLKKRFTDSYTWKSFSYLLLRFPLGILGFVVLVTFICLTISFIATPFLYYLHSAGVFSIPACSGSDWCWTINPVFAILVGVLGIFMIFVSFALFNGLARVYGILARSMLSRGAVRPRFNRRVAPKKVTARRTKAKMRKGVRKKGNNKR